MEWEPLHITRGGREGGVGESLDHWSGDFPAAQDGGGV